ncbi:hypothetical protein A2U01_0055819, partial [Trifolium medium]|nr:hypothetical protein [Trifolium medium]
MSRLRSVCRISDSNKK